MEKSFVPFCGSSLAITAAFLTRLDIERKIAEIVKSAGDQKKGFPGTITWANGRISFCKSVVGIVTSFIKDLNHFSKTPYFSVISSIEGVPNKKANPKPSSRYCLIHQQASLERSTAHQARTFLTMRSRCFRGFDTQEHNN